MPINLSSAYDALQAAGLIVAGGFGGAFTAYLGRRKTGAEAEATLSNAILAYTNKLTTDMDSLRGHLQKTDDYKMKLEDELDTIRTKLGEAQAKADQLKEIVKSLEARKANDKVIIGKLLTALKASDPNNPVINELQNMTSVP